MPLPTFLIPTWDSGFFSVTGDLVHHAHAGRMVRGLAPDGRGGVLAIIENHTLSRRDADGAWTVITESEHPLSCCVAVGDTIFVGTDDAQVLRLEAGGTPRRLPGFDTVDGRDTWYAGAAIVDGKLMGPPLGLRSMAATCDGAVVLANVHVGGIPRSTDGGKTWRPTIAVDADVHQVCTHPARPDLVIAAAAVGLCVSRDGGITWTIEARGLHAPHCSAVTFSAHDILVSASIDPFSPQGAVYRRPIDGDGPLEPLNGGMPRWTEGITDTGGIAVQGSMIAVISRAGGLHVSRDDGATWTQAPVRIPAASGLYIC